MTTPRLSHFRYVNRMRGRCDVNFSKGVDAVSKEGWRPMQHPSFGSWRFANQPLSRRETAALLAVCAPARKGLQKGESSEQSVGEGTWT
jgi:hypothetical protein